MMSESDCADVEGETNGSTVLLYGTAMYCGQRKQYNMKSFKNQSITIYFVSSIADHYITMYNVIYTALESKSQSKIMGNGHRGIGPF